MVQFHATTICAVRRGPDDVCIGGDGQVTMGETAIMKNGAKKVRKNKFMPKECYMGSRYKKNKSKSGQKIGEKV